MKINPTMPTASAPPIDPMVRGNIHVVYTRRGWALEVEGGQWYYSFARTQLDAISEGSNMARQAAASLIIHRKDGRFREVWTY